MKANSVFLIGATILSTAALASGAPKPTPPLIGAQVDDPAYSPAEVVAAMHRAFGYAHARAIFAKGVILEGTFTPDVQAKELTKAPHFQGASTKVIVRFSNFSGAPNIADNDRLASPHGMGVRFQLPGGKSTDLIAHTYNGFLVRGPDELRTLMLAIANSAGPAPAPTAFDKFLQQHPVTQRAYLSPRIPASFATVSYYGIGAFKFLNAKGEIHYGRYQVVPEQGERVLTSEEAKTQQPNYLIDDIKTRIAKSPVVFKLYAQLAERHDDLTDLSAAWPDSHKRVLLGRLELNKLSANTPEEDEALAFAPSDVPPGIETADVMSSFFTKMFRLSAKDQAAAE